MERWTKRKTLAWVFIIMMSTIVLSGCSSMSAAQEKQLVSMGNSAGCACG